MTDWAGLLGSARAVIDAAGTPAAARFLATWPATEMPRSVTPATLPVLCWLRAAADAAPAGVLRRFADGLARSASGLCWRQSYRDGDVPRTFLERYGWCELLGRAGPVPCMTLAGGVLLLGPETHYPAHTHAAEELYVPVSGAAWWQRGRCDWEQRRPGAAIVHASAEPHAMRTGSQPLLALYLWRGDGLDAGATLATSGAPR